MGYASLIFLLLLNLILPFSSGKSNGLCVSQGGRFPPFSSDGKPPKKVSRGSKDLTLCRVFRQKTCCDVAQTHPALLNIRKLASTGEANQECLQLWELLECSICNPQVGVQPGPPRLCSSLCDRVFNACSDAYFSMEAMTQVLAPCGVNDFVCGRASQWVHNGTELCHAAGFAVKDDLVGESCYGGKATGLLFLSKRKSHNHRQKLAAIQRTARKMEGQMNQNYPGYQANKKASFKVGGQKQRPAHDSIECYTWHGSVRKVL
ncbi:hypothetical protein F8388_018464 [Cannabis sativa]|uniref:Folate receptor-like domain-containing protein n=1 Tax=Cannabis sativa TaxID=3483 RepID=A0A7J6F2C8_CANSA|nr:hypothetical protein G4B88_025632 [Cannabis sativa]KAF4364788.1 hypothetical protein F8388_018464 [Cannabis sativa]